VKKPAPRATETTVSKALRRYLYFTAACTGAAIMVVEILGAKMLSPYFGLSHFVWTAQIAITLVALATGYYAGGRLADRSQQLPWLYWSILGAAVYLALSVLICRPVSFWCLEFNLALGSLLTSMILFFLPLALLAMTGPFLVRVLTSSVAGVGGNVGRLTAIGTLGSFAGTMLIGYLMIPLMANSLAMCFTALLLGAVCTVYFIAFRPSSPAPMLLVPALGLVTWIILLQGQKHQYRWVVEQFSGNSNFGRLQVVERDDGSCRFYLNDNLTQNTYDPERKQSESQFTYMLAGLARAYTTNITDVLCIGLGVGIVPMDFAHQGANVDVVEINPAVVPVAVRFFDLETNKIHITIDDARHFLNRCQKQYDAVVLDAFLGDSSPSHLMTREAFTSIRRVLRPGGTLTINMFGSVKKGGDYFAASLARTLHEVFPGVKLHSNGDGAIFFAASARSPLEFAHQPNFEGIHPDVATEVPSSFANIVQADPTHGRILTDDYNPIEFYDAKHREDTRRRLAKSNKTMFELRL
jgi:spermidine synthase